MLESAERAAKRNASVHAELYGYGLSWDAFHITQPEPAGEGMNRAIAMALAEANVPADKIDYVNVHGTGTRANDAAETVGLKRYFGNGHDATGVPPISATKIIHRTHARRVQRAGCNHIHRWYAERLATSNCQLHRSTPCCELDCVPNLPRSHRLAISSLSQPPLLEPTRSSWVAKLDKVLVQRSVWQKKIS